MMRMEADEADEVALSESEDVLSVGEKDMQAKGRHGIDEVSIETAAIDETGAVEIQDGENENTDTETTVNSIEEYSDVVEEVGNKTEIVSENVDEKSDTSVDDETEDERVSSLLRQNTEDEIKQNRFQPFRRECYRKERKKGRTIRIIPMLMFTMWKRCMWQLNK